MKLGIVTPAQQKQLAKAKDAQVVIGTVQVAAFTRDTKSPLPARAAQIQRLAEIEKQLSKFFDVAAEIGLTQAEIRSLEAIPNILSNVKTPAGIAA